MKQKLLRTGCVVLSLSLAAGLLTSCSILPTPTTPVSSNSFKQEEPPLYDSTALQDGRLRILYSNGSNGGNTVLCGDTVLYQAASSETVYLVSDNLTGTARYYLRQWSDASAPTGRLSALYDRTGKAVLTFDRAYDAALTGSLLVLTAPSEFAYDPAFHHAAGDCRVIDLSTGEELAVPENAYGCAVAGDYLAFNLCNVPADAETGTDAWDQDLTPYYAVQVQNRQGEVVYECTLRTASTLSSYYGDNAAPTDWLNLSSYRIDGTTDMDYLFNPATREELYHYIQYTGSGTVCLYSNGKYQLVDLVSTEESQVLCEYDQPVRYYAPGLAITEPEVSTSETAGRYRFHDLLTGEEKDLYDVDTDDDTLAIYATDGTVRVFDRQTGALLTDTAIEPVENQVRAHIYAEGNGWAWIAQEDNDNYDDTAIHICGPDGTHKTLDPRTLEETYTYYSPLFSTEDALYFYGCYRGPGSSWLYDLLDSDGDVVVSGMSSCAGYYSNSINGLPEGVFAATKGFYSGWMDVSGQWLYCESRFASTSDELDSYYF